MWVTLIAASTLCGRISPDIKGSNLDRQHLEQMRMATGAGLMGAATLRIDDPEMRAVGGVLPPERIRSVITTSQTLPFHKRFFSSNPFPVVFTSELSVAALKQQSPPGVEVVAVPFFAKGLLSLQHVLEWLEQKGVHSVLIEGGGRLNYAAFSQQIIDDIYLTVIPRIEGGVNGAMFLAGEKGLAQALRLVNCLSLETGEVILHYEVLK